MKKRIVSATLLMLLVLLTVMAVGARENGGGFQIVGADDSAMLGMSGSSTLEGLLASVDPHFIMQAANANLKLDLVPVPGGLQNLIAQVELRPVIRFANDNRSYGLDYPADLIDDNVPPQVTEIEAQPLGSNSATIVWTTDEFADSVVQYGTQPGVYDETVSDPLYVKQHELTLTGLAPGTTYYYKVSSTDLSGNTVESAEYSFIPEIPVYLPVIVR